MNESKSTSQHFIPQCYLRCFSNNGRSIHVYSKKYNRTNSIQTISKTAAKFNFYTIQKKYIDRQKLDDFDPNFYEREFFAENIESLFGPLLKLINEKALDWKVNNSSSDVLALGEMQVLAYQIAIQYLRMPNIRDKFGSFNEKVSHARLEMIKSFMNVEFPWNKEFLDSIKSEADENYHAVLHAMIFSDPDRINAIQDSLLNKFWVFYYSDIGHFYTSDNPIIIKPHLNNQPPILEGFDMSGAEIIFPIGNNVLLTLWDTAYFKDKADQHNRFQIINPKLKRQYNLYQYIWSNEEVYCQENDFELIKLFKEINNGKEVITNRPNIVVNGNKAQMLEITTLKIDTSGIY